MMAVNRRAGVGTHISVGRGAGFCDVYDYIQNARACTTLQSDGLLREEEQGVAARSQVTDETSEKYNV